MDFKDQWDVETAMKVLEHQTVDSKLWAEAIEWLILYGPPEIQKILLEASAIATESSFPDLKPSHYTDDGMPCYDIAALAMELGTTEDEVRNIIELKEKMHGDRDLADIKNATVH